MSLVNLSHVCSHLQNASLARLGLTSIPLSKLHLSLSIHLQKQGFLSSVSLGGPSPPAKLLPPSSSEPSAVASAQKKSSVLEEVEKVTQENRASRRLWLGMKYWDGEPVLRKMNMLSKPTKRIWLDSQELGQIVRGRDAQFVRGMRGVGECIFVSTDRGIMEARECVERKIGGMVLCRVW
ncbi:ribosomal protein S8 [Delphinella strobiligena]|nr:ribosomal protein S8 [Delphinella strobiligena]